MPDLCQNCGADRKGAMFECPSCQAMPAKKTLGLNDTQIAVRLGDGASIDELIALLVQQGADAQTARTRVIRVDAERLASGNDLRSFDQEAKNFYLSNFICGLAVLIITVPTYVYFSHNIPIGWVLLMFTAGGGQFSYAAYRLFMMTLGPKENR
jgi:hypothetical protein